MSIMADWTPDCQGKQDFDGPIIEVSTRYWPRGGGFSVLVDGQWQENADRPKIKPSAHCSILLRDSEAARDTVLVDARFEGETEEEVKQAVERWANEQQQRIVLAVTCHDDLLEACKTADQFLSDLLRNDGTVPNTGVDDLRDLLKQAREAIAQATQPADAGKEGRGELSSLPERAFFVPQTVTRQQLGARLCPGRQKCC
jgi:hypothetical protein